MARSHGRNARLYADLPGTGAATPVLNQAAFQVVDTTDKQDVTSFGDSNHVYVVGLPDDKGNWSGFLDTTGGDFYTAARDGVDRKFYFYIDTVNAPTAYFYGKAFFDQTTDVAVGAASKISGTWTASTAILRSY